MSRLTGTHRPTFADLVELVQLTDTPDKARTAVMNYLSQFPRICPTDRCLHDLDQAPFLCKNFRFRWHTFETVHGELRESVSEGYALSTQEMCTALQETVDPKKEACHECRTSNRVLRGKLDGIYCHGCGFFIDFGRKQIGYTQEWTVSEATGASPLFVLGKKCSNCANPDVKAKFADYFFCSESCLNEWLSEPSKSAP